MNTLKLDLGVQEYSLNDACTVAFNPTDVAFIGRLYDAFDLLSKDQEDYEKKAKSFGTAKELLDFMSEKDKGMRQVIDGVFKIPVCDLVFDEMNVFALSGGGLPVWSNLLLAVLDCCEADAKAKTSKTNATMEKYLKKYHK